MESLNLIRYLVLRDNILRDAVSQNNHALSFNYFSFYKIQAVLPDTRREECGEKYAASKTNIWQFCGCASAYQENVIAQK